MKIIKIILYLLFLIACSTVEEGTSSGEIVVDVESGDLFDKYVNDEVISEAESTALIEYFLANYQANEGNIVEDPIAVEVEEGIITSEQAEIINLTFVLGGDLGDSAGSQASTDIMSVEDTNVV